MNAKPVLEALLRLIRVEGKASITSIARASGISFREVLRVLDENRHLLVKDKTQRITGTQLSTLYQKERQRAIDEGRAYLISRINYGSDEEIFCKGPVRAELQKDYWSGGFGDSALTPCILNRPENLEAVRARGLVHIDELDLDWMTPWKEVSLVAAQP